MVALLPLGGWAVWQWHTVSRAMLPPLALAGMLLALYALAQYFLGVIGFRSDALLAAFYWLVFAMAVLTGSQVQRLNTTLFVGKGLQVFWLAWVVAGVVSLGMALHQWLDLSYFGLFIAEMPPRGRPFANLAQPNHLATLLLLSIAGVLYLYESRALSAGSAWLAITAFCFGLAMTESRSVLLGMVFSLAAFEFMRRRATLRFPAWGMLALFLLYLGWVLLWPMINQLLLLDRALQSTLSRTTPGVRVIYWVSSWDAIIMKPWLGWGFGQIGMAQQATALDYPATYTFFSSTHNIGIDLLLWMGLPAFLVLAWALVRHWARCNCVVKADSGLWVAWIGLAFIAGHAMVEFPLSYLYFLIPFGFLWGVLYQPVQWPLRNRQNGILRVVKMSFFSSLCLVFLGFFTKGTLEYLSWEADAQNLRFELQRYDQVTPPFEPSWVIFDQIRVMHLVARATPDRHMSEQELAIFQRNAERHPTSVALLRYAYAAGLNGHPQAARHSLRLLCSLHTMMLCQAARLEWKAASDQRWPELRTVHFPAPHEYRADEPLVMFNHVMRR